MLLIKRHSLLLIFLTIYFLTIAYKLISHPTPFFDWDETINVQVAKEMIEKNSLVPLWQNKVWLDKPPFPFIFFGAIMKLTPFLQPEISLRVTALILSVTSLILIYAIFYKAVKNQLIPLLTVIITSFTPIFLQRSQILNLDVFLLIGWLGYLIFVQSFWLSFVFLTISVLTKSLIGFYPAFVLLIYYIVSPILQKYKLLQQSKLEYSKSKQIRTVNLHIGILSVWYLLMLFFYQGDFWQQHIIETHFRRVTASIESHFGQRTYYFDLIFQQLGWFVGLSVIGLSVIIRRLIRRKLTAYQLLYSLFLLPWFLFLNLTKTKIFWYLYPAIPQFAFLSVYPLTLFKNKKNIIYILSFLLVLYLFQQNFIRTNLFTTFYSKPEDYYLLTLYARDNCESLKVLVGKETRAATKTLENLGLTITSTRQWGDHPSFVYYFGKPVNFYYDDKIMKKNLDLSSKFDCLVIRQDDLNLNWKIAGFKQIKNYDSYYLFKR